MPYLSRCRKPLVLALLATLPGTALAIEPLDHFSFSAGGYISRFDTEVRANGESVAGTQIDLDKDLGLKTDNTLGYARFTWRPFDRHEFSASYFGNGVSVDHRLEREIVFDDKVYLAGATVHAGYDLDSYELGYTWWAWSKEDWALGPRLGATVYRLDLGLELKLDVDGNPVAGGALDAEFRGDLPAPTLGASWRWTPAEQWRVSADAGWLNTTINNIDGRVSYLRAGVEWHPWKNAGLMLDYNLIDISASTERRLFTGHLDVRNSGVRLGLVVRY